MAISPLVGDAGTDRHVDELAQEHRKAIGRAVRQARRNAGFTMRRLAEQSGVSQPFLSMVENGRNTPSIAVLYRIAAALGVTPQTLLGEPDEPTMTVVRKDEARVFRVAGENDTRSALARFLGGTRLRFEAYDFFDVAPGQDLGGEFTHEGYAFVMVIHGALRISVGDDVVELAEGDCVHYEGTRPHRWDVIGEHNTRVLLVIDRAGDDGGRRDSSPAHPWAR